MKRYIAIAIILTASLATAQPIREPNREQGPVMLTITREDAVALRAALDAALAAQPDARVLVVEAPRPAAKRALVSLSIALGAVPQYSSRESMPDGTVILNNVIVPTGQRDRTPKPSGHYNIEGREH